MHSKFLQELLRAEPTKRVRGRLKGRLVRALAYQVDHVCPGAAYFAVRHDGMDGHDRMVEAIQRGAGTVVCEREGFLPASTVSVRVADSRLALARAAACFHDHPSRHMKLVGVTGGGDLAAFAFLLRSLLAQTGEHIGLIGGLEHRVGDRILPPQTGGEEALEVQRMLAAMLRQGQRRAVIELGSVARRHGWATDLSLSTLIQLPPGGSAGRTRSHDFHAETHRRLEWTADGRLLRVWSGQEDVVYQLEVAGLECGRRGSRLALRTPTGRRTLHTSLLGRRQARRLTEAVAAAVALGVPWPRLARAVRRLSPVPGHLEPVDAGQPFPVLVDGAESPPALLATLNEVRPLLSGRLLLMVGGTAEQSETTWRRLGRIAALAADRALVTTHNPGKESPERIGAALLEGARQTDRGNVAAEPDRARAIARLIEEAGPDDVVLLTGKGHRARQELDHCVIPFDDRVHARLTLETWAWPSPGEAPGPVRTSAP